MVSGRENGANKPALSAFGIKPTNADCSVLSPLNWITVWITLIVDPPNEQRTGEEFRKFHRD